MVWSYSRLTTFENCPYAWMKTYIYEAPQKDMFFTEFGGLMHRILEGYIAGKLGKAQAYSKFISEYMDNLKQLAPTKKIANNYFKQGSDYILNISLPKRKTLGVEEEFEFTFAGYPFVGFIDWISEDDEGNIYITDHKSHDLRKRSGRKKPTQKDMELDEYYRQLYIYSEAYKQKYGKYPDYLEFNAFRTGEWIAEPFDINRLREVEYWADSTIKRITQDDDWLPLMSEWYCNNLCVVGDSCEWRELMR